MTRAAQNVATDATSDVSPAGPSSGSSKKFGHLHICFRDWQAIDTNPNNTYNALFSLEPPSQDTSTRNQIRRDLLEAFTSITVWLFEPPTDSVKDLRQRLTIEKTSSTFREQLRAFRMSLSTQLAEGMFLTGTNNRVLLTGKLMHALVQRVSSSLNKGEVVLPSSTYLTMMKEESRQLRDEYEKKLRERVQSALYTELDQEMDEYERYLGLRDEHSVDLFHKQSNRGKTPIFPDEDEVKTRFSMMLQVLREDVLDAQLTQIFGPIGSSDGSGHSDSLSLPLYREFMSDLDRMHAHTLSQFLALYESKYLTRWLSLSRRHGERVLDQVNKLFVGLLNAQTHSGVLEEELVMSEQQVETLLLPTTWQWIERETFASLSPTHCQSLATSQSPVYQDTLSLLQRHFQHTVAPSLRQAFQSYFQAFSERSENVLNSISKEMSQILDRAPGHLHESFSKGYPLLSLENYLNVQYKNLSAKLGSEFDSLYRPLIVPTDAQLDRVVGSSFLSSAGVSAFGKDLVTHVLTAVYPPDHSLASTVPPVTVVRECRALVTKKFQDFCATEAKPAMTNRYKELRNTCERQALEQALQVIERRMDALSKEVQDSEGEIVWSLDEVDLRIDDDVEVTWREIITSLSGWLLTPRNAKGVPPTSLSPDDITELEGTDLGKGLHDYLLEVAQSYRDCLRDLLEQRERERLEQERLERERERKKREEQERERQRIAEERERQRKAVLEQEERERLERERERERERESLARAGEVQRLAELAAAEAAAAEEEEREYETAEDYYDNDDNDVEIEEEEEEVKPIKKATASKGKKASTGSSSSVGVVSDAVAEQKRRAAEWAAKAFGTGPAAKKTTGTSSSSTTTASTVKGKGKATTTTPQLTAQQQRERAMAFASKTFGKDIIEESEDEDEIDEGAYGVGESPTRSTNRRQSLQLSKEEALAKARREAALALEESQSKAIMSIASKPKPVKKNSKK